MLNKRLKPVLRIAFLQKLKTTENLMKTFKISLKVNMHVTNQVILSYIKAKNFVFPILTLYQYLLEHFPSNSSNIIYIIPKSSKNELSNQRKYNISHKSHHNSHSQIFSQLQSMLEIRDLLMLHYRIQYNFYTSIINSIFNENPNNLI